MVRAMMTAAVALWLASGCGGESNPCAQAAAHLEQCAGISIAVPATCNALKAEAVLNLPCDSMANSRGTFSANWAPGGFFEEWFNDPQSTNPWDYGSDDDLADIDGFYLPDIRNRTGPDQDPASPWIWYLYMKCYLDECDFASL